MSNLTDDQRKSIVSMIRAVADGLEDGRFHLVESDFTLPFQADETGWHHRKMVVEVREFWGMVDFDPFGLDTVVVSPGGNCSGTPTTSDEEFNIHEWSDKWRRDSRRWCVDNDDVVDVRLSNALWRASLVREDEYKMVDGNYTRVKAPPHLVHILSIPRHMDRLPDFEDACPLIASGAMKIRNVGEKSRQLIAGVLRR